MNTTQLEKKATAVKVTSETVREFLAFDELEYNTILFESGMRFIERIYPLDSKEYILHSRNKVFWSWFRLCYDQSAASYLSRASNLKHVTNMRNGILISLFHKDMNLFCVNSNAIKESFKNYLKVHKRYGTRG